MKIQRSLLRFVPIILLFLAFGRIESRCDAFDAITIGGIAPHHEVAEKMILDFYEQLSAIASEPKRVILLGPDHFNSGKTPVTLCGADWETPTGTLSADRTLSDFLLDSKTAARQDEIFRREHSITVHIPFIHKYLKNAVILPLIIQSRATDIQILTLRKQLLSFLQEGGVLLLSMDFSHYKTPNEADAEDRKTISSIKNFTVKRGLDYRLPSGHSPLSRDNERLGQYKHFHLGAHKLRKDTRKKRYFLHQLLHLDIPIKSEGQRQPSPTPIILLDTSD